MSISSLIKKSGGTHDTLDSKEMSKIGLPHLDKEPQELFQWYKERCDNLKEMFSIFDEVDGMYTLVGYSFRKVLSVSDRATGIVFYEDNSSSPEEFEYRKVQSTRKGK